MMQIDPADTSGGFGTRIANLLTIFSVALRLGLTSFGGPIAHIGFFRQEYVENRRWLSERRFSDIVALCHFLPGPTSSQVGIAVGITRGGLLGGLLAWLGFTAPSAALLIAFGFGITEFPDLLDGAWLNGLKIAAVAVVATALWGMATSLAPDRERATVAIVSAIALLLSPITFGIVIVIVLAGIYGWWRMGRHVDETASEAASYSIWKPIAIGCAVIFALLLIALPLLRQVLDSDMLSIFDGFFRSGSLVFGGGHVVLPTLESEVVTTGWLSSDSFMAGYGAAQAIPGPLFTFAGYLGTVMSIGPGGVLGGLFALFAIFLSSFLLVIAILPFWDVLNGAHGFRAALIGINPAVVGVLAAALFDPVWLTSIKEPSDFALAAAAFAMLMFWRVPPWLIVILCALSAIPLAALKG